MRGLILFASLMLAGCGSTPDVPTPADDLRDRTPEVSVSRDWQRHVSHGAPVAGSALPVVVADEHLYLADGRGRVYALQPDNGRRDWRMQVDIGVSGGPGVDDGLFVVGSRDGRVVAVQAPDGDTHWRQQLSSEVLSVPAVASEHVFVRTADGQLHALARESGRERWSHDGDVPALALRGTGDPVVTDDYVVAGFDDGELKALERTSGEVAWSVTVSEPRGSADMDRVRDVDATPVVRDDTVYSVGYRGQLLAVSLADGSVAWDRDLSSNAGLDVGPERVYVSGEDGVITAVDRRTGSLIWQQDDTEGLRPSAPAYHEDFVVLGDDRGRVTVLSARDGRILGRFVVSDGVAITRAPVFADGRFHVTTEAGHVMRFGLTLREGEESDDEDS